MRTRSPMPFAGALLALAAGAGPAPAGGNYPAYIDGGQSADGRYTVTAAPAGGKPPHGPFRWTFTWTDTRTKQTHTGDLKGVSAGLLYAHVFVSPDGERFAVWNPLMLHVGDGTRPRRPTDEERRDPAWRAAAFSRRLVIYTKTGEVVKELGVDDLTPPGGRAGGTAFERVHWLREYPGLSWRTAPRPAYALYRVSPDYTVLEYVPLRPKGTEERAVRVSLVDGRRLAETDAAGEPGKTPVQPFKAGKQTLDRAGRERYVPSLDPVRIEGAVPGGR